jgi:hypothetical protein
MNQCNMCGRELSYIDINCNPFHLLYDVGYGSIYDMDTVDCKLCCSCQDNLIKYLKKKCVVNPVHINSAK